VTIFQRWKQTALHNKALVLTGSIVALGTVVSTGAVTFQLWMAKENNKSTSGQIEKLIGAANIQANAATNFADSASHINLGIERAVDKLNLQATATTRLSRDSEIANNNFLEADRPWMAAFVSVTNFDIGKKPTFAITFANTGKRPARVDLTATRENWYAQFPSRPDQEYIYDTTPSTSFIVPGQSSASISALPEPLSQPEIAAAIAGHITYFVFGKVEYRDTRTNQSYWTHVCLRYMPNMKSDTDNGFRNCAQYNDAK
jgi:hypothetical protein